MVEGFKQWRVYVEGVTHPARSTPTTRTWNTFPRPTLPPDDTPDGQLPWQPMTTLSATGKAPPTTKRMPSPAIQTSFPPPLPSLPIFPTSDPLLNSPHLIGAAVLITPDDPLLPAIVAAQAADLVLSAHIQLLQKGPGGGSNPALPEGSLMGRSQVRVYTLHEGLLYS